MDRGQSGSTRKIARLPTVDRTNGWSAILPERRPKEALAGDVTADWIVLGAGYAGLAAARRLAENRPDESVALIDAGEAGENASGRNSGFAIDLPHNVGSSLDELEGSHRFMRLARFAIDHLQATIEAHDIACDWSLDGKYHAAVSPRGVKEVLEPFARELEALGEPFEWIEKDALETILGSPHFTAAIYTPGGALMNPAALTRGLADSLPANVTLYENSPVTEAIFENGVQLTSAGGTLRAPRIILAANGYAEQFGFYPKRFMHLMAHASLTRQLTEAEQSRLWRAKTLGHDAGERVCRDHDALHQRSPHRHSPRLGILPKPDRHASAAGPDQATSQAPVRRPLSHAARCRHGAYLERCRLPLAQQRARLWPAALERLVRRLSERGRRHQGHLRRHSRRRHGDRTGQSVDRGHAVSRRTQPPSAETFPGHWRSRALRLGTLHQPSRGLMMRLCC